MCSMSCGAYRVDGNLVEFTYKSIKAKGVFVAGVFNNWGVTRDGRQQLTTNMLPMKKSEEDNWTATITVESPSVMEYKFIADGTWYDDKENPDFLINRFGSRNSILVSASGNDVAAARELAGLLAKHGEISSTDARSDFAKYEERYSNSKPNLVSEARFLVGNGSLDRDAELEYKSN